MIVTEYLLGTITGPPENDRVPVDFVTAYSIAARPTSYRTTIKPQSLDTNCTVDLVDTAIGAPVEWVYWVDRDNYDPDYDTNHEHSYIRTPHWHREA